MQQLAASFHVGHRVHFATSLRRDVNTQVIVLQTNRRDVSRGSLRAILVEEKVWHASGNNAAITG